MSSDNRLDRREWLVGLAGVGAVLTGACATAQAQKTPTVAQPSPKAPAPKADGSGHAAHAVKDAAPAAPLSAQHKAVIDTTAECAAAGRLCLARCTDHLAAGTDLMAVCQRAVMNMLVVVEAMADVAGFANAAPADLKALAKTCAQFCRSCAKACEPHAGHHEECKACMDACLACAKACEALAA